VRAQLNRIGGSDILLEVDPKDLRRRLLETLRDEARQLLRESRIGWLARPLIRDDAVEIQIRNPDDVARTLNVIAETIVTPAGGVEVVNMDNGVLRLTVPESVVAAKIRTSRATAIETVTKRIGEMGIADASVQPEGFGRIRVLLPGVRDPNRGAQLIPSMPRLAVRLVNVLMDPCNAVDDQASPDSEMLFSRRDKTSYLIRRQVVAEGADLAGAVAAIDRRTQEPIVAFRFDGAGAYRFARMAREHVGRPFAIVVDHEVILVPIIVEPLQGVVQISGSLSLGEAKDLATLVRAAMGLPARLIVVEQHIVQPVPAK
jgi:protein-export membrane protein SecD